MSCYHPIEMFRSRAGRNPETGKWSLASNTVEGYGDLPVTVPCGRCIGCRLDRSRHWAVRCVHEAQQHEVNSFITLTFDDDHLDRRGSLNKIDFTHFVKRLRDRVGYDLIRYFHCGEYGSQGLRPHHHAIIFGYDFPDRVLWSRGQTPLYRSALLEQLWPYGFCTVGEVTFESAAYVARYVLKKVTGDAAEEHYQGRVPEYVTMSRRPGIANDWAYEYYDDVYPHDYVIIRNGIKCKPPRYYDNIYDIIDHKSMSKVKRERVKKARDSPENTVDRLRVREVVQERKLEKLVRNL
ncbi:replication initiator protein [Termite gut associated microvirus 1]|nr:replication initiator protein [Termite gut associated microvirus 1]